jgi:hypothetical protein
MWQLLLVQGKRMGSKSRLIAFGCSYTYGQFLAYTNPSELAWPSRLGNLLGLDVVNKGKAGASNLEILHNILSFPFAKDDIAVIGWTHVNRDYIFGKNMHTSIGPWSDHSILEPWVQTHSDYDLSVRSGLYIHYAELFLESLNIKQYHFQAIGSATVVDKIINAFTQIKPVYTNKLKHQIKQRILYKKDLALDNEHPGVEAHADAAMKLYKIINEK